jgi:DNA-binding NarL/FixJ family response regulator
MRKKTESSRLYLLAPPDQQTRYLIATLHGHDREVLAITENTPPIEKDAVCIFDLRLLEEFRRLSTPAQCRLTQGRWLLINAQKPFSEDFLLFYGGVYGLLHTGETRAYLLPALNAISRGELWIPRAFLAQVFKHQRLNEHSKSPVLPDLTRREWQVIAGLLAAENNRQISQRLNVEESTVKRHFYNLFRKLGVRNRLEALNWAHATGLQRGADLKASKVI